MTDVEYRIQQKNKAINELARFFSHETQWLTLVDIQAIESHIEQLSQFIDERYKTHGRTAIEQ